jgi:lipopolysaccharide transport system permease protein
VQRFDAVIRAESQERGAGFYLSPEGVISLMPRALAREVGRLWTYGWQIWLDMVKELTSESRETAGRFLWVIITPLVPMGLYLFLAYLRVFPPHDRIAGIAYILVGAIFWFLYSGLFLAPISAVKRKGKTAAQSNYPLSAVVMSAALQAWVEFFIRAVFLAIVLAFIQPPDPMGAAKILGVIIPLSLFFLGMGMIVAVFCVAWKDLEKVVTITVQYLFFLSHVLFTLPEDVVPRWLAWCNPFAFAIDTSRWFLLFDEFLDIRIWIALSVIGVLVFLKALHFTAVSEKRLAAHL